MIVTYLHYLPFQAQKQHLNLPLFPTTTIGSFPQTKNIRVMRSRFATGEISAEKYDSFIEDEIRDAIAIQV